MQAQDTKCAAAAAVAALGLVTTWSDAEASSNAANNSTATITLNASATVGLSSSYAFFTNNNTITIDPPLQSVASSLGNIPTTINGLTVLLDSYATIGPNSRSWFAGSIDNGDGTSDLVLAFSGDGSQAIGAAWTSLFVDNIEQGRQAFEPQILAQMASEPVLNQGLVEPGSQLDILDRYYRDLLTSGWGESATLVAFNGAGNTGVAIGSITFTPAPGSLLALAAGSACMTRRRRG